MIYTVTLKASARRELLSIPSALQKRVEAEIDALAQNPRPSGVRKLSGYRNTFRVRVGDYRILYEIEDKILSVLVIRIGNRRDVYR